MKQERLLKIFGQIDEKYIEEAAPAILTSEDSHKINKFNFIKWGALAACAAVVVLAAVPIIYYTSNQPSPDSTEQTPVVADNLPILTSYFESDGMGFEGQMFYDISESDHANPWTEETELVTLPVYRNLAYVEPSGVPIYLSDEDMLQLAEKAVSDLGEIFDISDMQIESTDFNRYDEYAGDTRHTDALADKAASLTATTKLGEIRVSGNGEIAIFFSESIQLPEEYRFTVADTSHEDALKVLDYLTEEFSPLFELTQPVFNTSGDYYFSGEQNRNYQVYEGDGSIEEQILHYNFDKITFSPSEDGHLWIIRLGNVLNSAEKIGDYPLITADAAQKLLLAGDYITSVPNEYLEDGEIRKKHIAKVELVYRTGNTNEVFMPYYRFYVELTEFDSDMAEGLKNFGAYYVPAVRGEYLSDSPVWDGSFN